MRDTYGLGRRFVLQRARPIDHARWRFFFEGAPVDSVLDILAQYQNSDGGFGHALEADFWNPHSSPMQTWAATEILQSLNLGTEGHPVVDGILRYLESAKDFDGHIWNRTIPTNNDYPHAEWWTHQDTGQGSTDSNDERRGYNPTAALAGFAIQFSKPFSRLHNLAKQVAIEAFTALSRTSTVELHELSCFLTLFKCAVKHSADIGIDLSQVQTFIDKQVNSAITRDTSKWATEYVCRPSRFVRSPNDRWFSEYEDLLRYECKLLKETQLEDGSWPVVWHWSAFPNEWPVAQEWWRSIIVIENIQFLRNMGEI